MAIDIEVPDDAWRWPFRVRYYEQDAQRVVYHGWYLNYIDEAQMAFLDHVGYGSEVSEADGLDWMVVHAEIDWIGSLRFADHGAVVVSPMHIGNSSVTFDFAVLNGDEPVASARNVYVCVKRPEYTRAEIPPVVHERLGPLRSLRRPRAGR